MNLDINYLKSFGKFVIHCEAEDQADELLKLVGVLYLVSSSDGQPRIHIGIGMIEIPATRYIWIIPKSRCNFRQLVTGKNTGTKLSRFTRFSRQMTSEKFKKMGVLIQICFMKLEFDYGHMERH